MSPVQNSYLLCQTRLRFSEAFKRCFLLPSIALGGGVWYLLVEQVQSVGLLGAPPRCANKGSGCQRYSPVPHPLPPAGTRATGSQQGLPLPWNTQVGTGEGAGGVTANIPVLMKDQLNSAVRAGGGEGKLSNILHCCSSSNPSSDPANRHFHLYGITDQNQLFSFLLNREVTII